MRDDAVISPVAVGQRCRARVCHGTHVAGDDQMAARHDALVHHAIENGCPGDLRSIVTTIERYSADPVQNARVIAPGKAVSYKRAFLGQDVHTEPTIF